MKNQALQLQSCGKRRVLNRAFSLIEVAVALGIFSFAVVAILGLFTVSLKTSKESEGEVQAASVASMLIAVRKAAPVADLGAFAIPKKALTQAYGPANPGQTAFIGPDGSLTNALAATYRMTCQAGTNAVTGTGLAQIYILLSWPPQADVDSPQTGHYEIIAQIPNH